MFGRNHIHLNYRYGFNGKETDSEWGAGDGTQDYGFRMYNPAIAKFLSVDPLSPYYPWYTPYQFAGNKPIWASDLDGLEEFFRTDYYDAVGNLYKTEITLVSNDGVVSFNGGGANTQTVHHTKVVRQDDNSYVKTYLESTIGSSTGTNAFASIESPNATFDSQIRMDALHLDAVGEPRVVPIPLQDKTILQAGTVLGGIVEPEIVEFQTSGFVLLPGTTQENSSGQGTWSDKAPVGFNKYYVKTDGELAGPVTSGAVTIRSGFVFGTIKRAAVFGEKRKEYNSTNTRAIGTVAPVDSPNWKNAVPDVEQRTGIQPLQPNGARFPYGSKVKEASGGSGQTIK
ncbi:MAG: RHS repeat-associated core domain-containing protein [Flavobacteriales bacterium]|nr:RHS repeat-associated core domain-containing protein [Flavobacteriales bacterium]